MATVIDNLIADSINATELTAGNMIVTGKARFIQPVYADLENAEDINKVSTQSISSTDYILLTNGTSLRKILMSDLINYLSDAINRISPDYDSAENVGY